MNKQDYRICFGFLLSCLLLFNIADSYADVTIGTAETATVDLEARNTGASRNATVSATGSVDVTATPAAGSAIWAKADGWNVTVLAGREIKGNGYGVLFNENSDGAGPFRSGVLENAGVIGATAATGDAAGVWTGGSSSRITNSGTIVATSTAVGSSAEGVFMMGNAATLANSGTITANGVFNGIGAYLFGLSTSVLTNNGTLTGNASGDNPWAVGAQIGGNDNTVTNDGAIAANAPGYNANKATALYFVGPKNRLTNNGTITAVATGDGSGTVESVWMAGDNNAVTNTGAIRATSDCCSRGVLLENGVSAVTNSGTIEALSTGYGGGDAAGVWMEGTTNTLVNRGVITATADLTAQGVRMQTGINAITNSGTIAARGIGAGGAAYAVWMEDTQNSLTNSGVITAASEVFASGACLNGMDGNVLTNSGAITGSPSGTGVAFGVQMVSTRGLNTVTNSGTITATSTPALPADAGMYLEGVANNITNSGTISGATGINAALGDTTLLNSGTITGTGGTAIQLANAVNAVTLKTGSVINGAIAGSFGPGDSLELNGTGSLAASQIVNFENLTKTNTGRWTITAGSAPLAIANAISLTAGTLAFGGDVTTPVYTQNSGANLGLIVSPTASATVTAGMAALNQGGVLIIPQSGLYARSTSYGVVFSAGAGTGAFGEVSSASPFLTPTLTAGANNYSLTVNRDFALPAATENQRAVADALNGYIDTLVGSAGNPELSALMQITDRTQAQVALDELAGLSHTAFTGIGFSSFNRYLNTLTGRMDSLATGGPATAHTGQILLAARNDVLNDAGNTLLALSALRDDRKSAASGLWLKGYGDLGRMSGDNRSSKYRYHTAGITGGFDRQIGPDVLAGLSVGYSRAEVKLNDLSEKATLSSYQGSLYGSYVARPWYLNGILAYGYNRNAGTRNISFGGIDRTAVADYAGHALAALVEAGYVLTVKTVSVTPLASFQAGALSRNGFTETDAGAFNLTVDKERTSSYLSALGIKASKDFTVRTATLTPEFRVKWLHEFANDDYLINAAFAGAPAATFTVRGEKPGRDTLDLGLGLTCVVRKNVNLFLAYDADFASDRFEQGGSLGIRYRW